MSQASLAEIELTTYDAGALVHLPPELTALLPLGEGRLPSPAEAAEREAYLLVAAAREKGILGYAGAYVEAGVVHIEPLALAPALDHGDADRVCRLLVAEILAALDRPWAPVAVQPGTPAVAALLREGWRHMQVPHDAAEVLLSGADARA